MRVLVADKLSPESLDEIRALGIELVYEPELEGEALARAVRDAGVLVVRGTEVNASAIEGAPGLSLIVRAGAGPANIDVAAASRRGVNVATTPGRNASAVVELTLGLIIALDRRIPDAAQSLRNGRWEKDEYARAEGLAGRKIGIAGLGHVGRGILRVAQALGMRPHAVSRTLTTARATELGVYRHDRIEDLARQSEVFSVHLELNERTRGIISRKVIEQLPDGAIFVNTARSELVDYEALADLAPKKGLRVGLDVLPDEPSVRSADYTHRIFGAGLVYATPHIGASTDRAQQEICSEVVRIIRAFLVEGEARGAVNIAATSRARYVLLVRHRDKVGAMANILGVLKRHGINLQELDNAVFEGGKAGCAKIRLDSRPGEGCIAEIMAFSEEVIGVQLVTLPNLA